MKRVLLVCISVCCLVVFVGCESMGEKTKTGAITGGLLGAAAGGIIGHQSGHGLEGAAIGAGAGALGGGLIGNSMDKKGQAVSPNQVSIVEIADMAAKGVPDSVIIGEIQQTKSKYNLTSEAISYLKENGASDAVIDAMLATASK